MPQGAIAVVVVVVAVVVVAAVDLLCIELYSQRVGLGTRTHVEYICH